MSDHEAVKIAAKLTAAQRWALLWLPVDGSASPGLRAPRGTAHSLRRIAAQGLCGVGSGWGWHATTLGLRVRAILTAQPPEAADG